MSKETMADRTSKERHGCLSVYLGCQIVCGALFIVLSVLFQTNRYFSKVKDLNPWWVLISLSILAVAYLLSGLAVWRWKKWGFFGMTVSGLILMILVGYMLEASFLI